MTTLPTVCLDDGDDDVAGYAELHGRRVPIYHLDGVGQELLAAIDTAGPTAVQASVYYDVVASCCPDLTREEVQRLRPKQVTKVLAVASLMIQRVEQHEAANPNGDGPAASAETTPASPA